MKKVYVGMSGGVDSSLSAALLKEQGYAVTGVYMKNWTQDLPGMKCPWADDLADAKRVAVQLGIPFKVFDFQTEYKQKVVDYMIAEYEAGRTPNPDVMCNQEVKFKLFLQAAIEDGAEMIATGHYARVENSMTTIHENTDVKIPEKTRNYIKKICARHNIELKKTTRFAAGFTNQVYKINNDLILKIYTEKENFINEKDILQSDLDIKRPKLIAQNKKEKYIIMEFINGSSLGHVWHKASETQRENLIKNICENLRKINKLDPEEFADYGKSWREILEYGKYNLQDSLKKLRKQKIFDKKEIKQAENFWRQNSHYFDNEKTTPVFWDIHLDNFIVDEKFNILAQIDFENIWLTAKDYPIYRLEKMMNNPRLYLSENDEKFADKDDYKNLRKYYEKYCPEMFAFKNLASRVRVYHFLDALKLIARFPNDEPLRAAYKNLVSRNYDAKKVWAEAEGATKNPMAKLLRAKDEEKDQTYFLYRITENALSKTLFPIGDFASKEEVRAEAEKRGLTTARKKDSQGICFVGEVGVRDFLSQFVETQPGNIIEQETGKILGQHDGAIFYTLGQRHGLNIGGGLPFYIVGKDMGKNEVYVSKNLNAPEFFRDQIELTDVHWINNPPESGKKYLARVRHRGKLIECEINYNCHPELVSGSTEYNVDSEYPEKSEISRGFQNDKIIVNLDEPQRAIAAGQSIVIYDDKICLGGGIVK